MSGIPTETLDGSDDREFAAQRPVDDDNSSTGTSNGSDDHEPAVARLVDSITKPKEFSNVSNDEMQRHLDAVSACIKLDNAMLADAATQNMKRCLSLIIDFNTRVSEYHKTRHGNMSRVALYNNAVDKVNKITVKNCKKWVGTSVDKVVLDFFLATNGNLLLLSGDRKFPTFLPPRDKKPAGTPTDRVMTYDGLTTVSETVESKDSTIWLTRDYPLCPASVAFSTFKMLIESATLEYQQFSNESLFGVRFIENPYSGWQATYHLTFNIQAGSSSGEISEGDTLVLSLITGQIKNYTTDKFIRKPIRDGSTKLFSHFFDKKTKELNEEGKKLDIMIKKRIFDLVREANDNPTSDNAFVRMLVFTCPHDDCGTDFLISKDVHERHVELECPSGHLICKSCKGKWHEDACPEFFSTLSEDIQRRVTEGFAKPCPFCYKVVEKNEGCNHMTCICGNAWCWVCRKPYNGIQYYHPECATGLEAQPVEWNDIDSDDDDDDDDE